MYILVMGEKYIAHSFRYLAEKYIVSIYRINHFVAGTNDRMKHSRPQNM